MRAAWVLSLFVMNSLIAGEYTIQLERPLKAGYTVNLIAKGKRKSLASYSKDGKVYNSSSEDFEVIFDGELTIKKVNAEGHDTITNIVVSKCERIEDGEKRAMIAPGTMLVLLRGGERNALVNLDNTEVDAEVRRTLEPIFPVQPAAADMAIDKVFPVKGPQKIGDEWPMDADACRKDWGKTAKNIDYSKGDLKGMAQLKGTLKENGVECMEISISMNVDLKNIKAPDVVIEKWRITGSFTNIFPIDTRLPILGVRKSWHTEYAAFNPDPNGGLIHSDITSDESAEIKVTYKQP